jgi:hypothetical protein
MTVDMQANWLDTPPPDAMATAIRAAELAAADNPAQCCVTIAESDAHSGWLVICGVRLLASIIRDGMDPAELRGELLGIAAQTDAPASAVNAAIESVRFAEAMANDHLDGLHQLCAASQTPALEVAFNTCASTGQCVAALSSDPAAVFGLFRAFYGIEDGAA